MIEIWKPIPGWKNLYEVSTLGRIKSLRNAKILRPSKCTNGYLDIVLTKLPKRRRERIHVLVLEAFVGPRPTGYWAAHLNGKRNDNRLLNLKWASRIENMFHKWEHGTQLFGSNHQNSKLKESDVRKIKLIFKNKESKKPPFDKDVAKQFGIARETVGNIRRGKWWKHVV